MSIQNMAWNAIKWKFIKKHIGFTNEEIKKIQENPRNEDV
jgi:hypothetical protein